MSLDALYQDVIMDHFRARHGSGLREPFQGESRQVNPTCGDEILLRVALDPGQGRIADVSYEASGCSISQASASVLHDQVRGASIDQAQAVEAAFLLLMHSRGEGLMHSRGEGPGDDPLLGDGIAFTGVSRYPARIKCALLAWMAFKDALQQAQVSTGSDGHPHQ